MQAKRENIAYSRQQKTQRSHPLGFSMPFVRGGLSLRLISDTEGFVFGVDPETRTQTPYIYGYLRFSKPLPYLLGLDQHSWQRSKESNFVLPVQSRTGCRFTRPLYLAPCTGFEPANRFRSNAFKAPSSPPGHTA